MTALGSSKYLDTLVPFSGILSLAPSQNPGCFAGGLATLIHCDNFRQLPPGHCQYAAGILFFCFDCFVGFAFADTGPDQAVSTAVEAAAAEDPNHPLSVRRVVRGWTVGRFGFPSVPIPPRPTDDNSRPIFDQKIELCTIKGNQTKGSAGGGASPAVPDSDASLVLALNDMF
ncbi:hypothetical protein QL285_036898 [Trifolium repens]|nr:hypothetical protein QL285_036898 [Trifolium repens]